MQIRKAETRDLSRIAEILVFVKRINYRPIFQNDAYSFGELQVLNVARQYAAPEILGRLWVYDDGIVKGLIHIEGEEIRELYVDHFFQGQGIGAQLIEFAKERFLCRHLWLFARCGRKKPKDRGKRQRRKEKKLDFSVAKRYTIAWKQSSSGSAALTLCAFGAGFIQKNAYFCASCFVCASGLPSVGPLFLRSGASLPPVSGRLGGALSLAEKKKWRSMKPFGTERCV